MSFELHITENTFQATFPRGAFDPARLAQLRAQSPPDVTANLDESAPDTLRLVLRGAAESTRTAAARLFAQLNGYPSFPAHTLAGFRNADAPLVSCVVLLPFNELFARQVLLPSIIQHSQPHPIEIILVLAGFGINRAPFEHLRQYDSELTSIARGYNLGVRAARGEYVALFHDDCYLDDSAWIPKALAGLRDDVLAVSPEFDHWQAVPVAKGVPLVMRRCDFLALGGYDEHYYAGVEDMDLTVAVHAAGGRAAHVDIGYRHLRGMGTSLILHERPHQLKLLFGYQVLPAPVIARVHQDMMQRLLAHGFVRMLEGAYHLHFLDKFGPLLAERFAVDVERMRHAYELMRYPYLLTPAWAYLSDRAKLVEAYRALMNVAELERPLEI
jgi:glycosyltransferase involved in cell wall biosynthesis